MDLTLEPNSLNVRQIESPTLIDYRHANRNEMTMQFAQPCQGQDSRSCSPEMGQVMTLPLLSSDSFAEMQMMCDTPESRHHDLSDDWTMADCAVPKNDRTDDVPNSSQSPNAPEEGTTTQEVTNLSAECSADLTLGDYTDAEKAQRRECISRTSEQSHQSNHVEGKYDDTQARLDLKREHFASSHLLSQFMAMTGATQSITCPSFSCATSSTISLPTSKTEGSESTLVTRAGQRLNAELDERPRKFLPAVSPNISGPSKSGCCLVSLQLGHSVIRHLEELWPAKHLVDRDFCSHICIENERLRDGSAAIPSTTFQASEVDVSLTAEDGIIVTTLLQISQKPLPGSTATTTIRQRVYNLSQKYQRLTILVVKSPGARDLMSELSPKDLDIYTDFVCFALSMKANITVCLVPGGDKTLSRWILSMMIQFAPRLVELDEATTIGNTTWELFFRQTGMNVRAAQVLSHSLFKEFGPSGLTAFLTMTSAEETLEYGRKLGIERHIARCFSVLGIPNPDARGPSVGI